ncbi:transporter substrate-binding domain-containing protein, partial [Yersinia pestis]
TGRGIAERLSKTELHGKLDSALTKVKADGTYQTIYKKWFQK